LKKIILHRTGKNNKSNAPKETSQFFSYAEKSPKTFKKSDFFRQNRRTASRKSATHFSFRFSRFGVKIGFGVQKFFENFEIFFSIFFDFWPILGQKSRFLAKNAQK